MLLVAWQTGAINIQWVALAGLAVLAALAVFLFIGGRVVPNYKLYVRTFEATHSGITAKERQNFSTYLLSEWHRITRAHSYETLVDQGEENLANIKWFNEDMGLVVREISEDHLEQHPIASKLLPIIDRIWPRYVLTGQLTPNPNGDGVQSSASLTYSGKSLTTWREPEEDWQPADLQQVAHRMAYRIIFDVLRDPSLFDGVLVGTVNREAFYFHSLGLVKWYDYRPDNALMFDEIDGLFASSLEHDPLYALAHYNRGVLYYELGRGEKSNKQALQYFERAIKVAERVRQDELGLRKHIQSCLVASSDISPKSDTVDQIVIGLNQSAKRVKGLSLIGVSRCYSQEVHRYGADASLSQFAREAAAHAEKVLGNTPAVLYAKAFAWHCTENLSDIRTGADYYRQIIQEYPRKFATVHLNLGYILMVGAEQLDTLGSESLEEAKAWYAEAEGHSKVAAEISRDGSRIKKYALANLGNISRLRGAYADARSNYQQAVDSDSEYINGIAEYSWVFVEERNFAEALYWHKRALETAIQNSGEAHVIKIRKDFARKLFEVGHLARVESDKLVQLSELVKTDNTNEWLDVLGQTSLHDL